MGWGRSARQGPTAVVVAAAAKRWLRQQHGRSSRDCGGCDTAIRVAANECSGWRSYFLEQLIPEERGACTLRACVPCAAWMQHLSVVRVWRPRVCV